MINLPSELNKWVEGEEGQSTSLKCYVITYNSTYRIHMRTV